MEKERSTNLVGVVIGSILRGGHPLAFYLYTDPGGKYHTRVDELAQFDTPHQALGALARSFRPAVLEIYYNRYHPAWYFLQLQEGATPNVMRAFGLPWAAYWAWETRLDCETGLVGLSISPHHVDVLGQPGRD